jgi:Protein of unknown function (DUF2442)/Domain of unknown function (DUF4160)
LIRGIPKSCTANRDEHEPTEAQPSMDPQGGIPHFHALYAGRDASIAIETLEVLGGSLPDRALRLVREWATLHRAELEADWQRARDGQPLDRIPPLP